MEVCGFIHSYEKCLDFTIKAECDYIKNTEKKFQKGDSNPRLENQTAT